MRRYVFFGVIAVFILFIWLRFFPPRAWLNLTKNVPMTAESGKMLVERYNCRDCHRIQGEGALVGPQLDGILLRTDPMIVRLWLHNPRAIKGNTPMPNFHLSDSEIEAIMAYLETLSSEATP